jgi:hypothetical protein
MSRCAFLALALLLASPALPQVTPPAFTSVVIDPARAGDCKAIADIDLDGDGDAVLGGDSLAWYEAGAGWARRVIRSAPIFQEFTTDMQAGDVDGDGDPDLIVGDGNGTGNVLWFENPRRNPPPGAGSDPGVGANWVHHTIGTHGDWTHDVEVADVDRDGRLDVLTSGHGHTHLWLQGAPTSWSAGDLSALAGSGVFLGDIDGDGRTDIALPDGWLRAPADPLGGAWSFFPISGAGDGDEVVAADINGDGRLDIATCDAHSAGGFAWFEAPPDPTQPGWTRRVIDPAMGAHHPEPADFDADGRMDLLMGLERADLSVYLNQGGSPPLFLKVQLDTTSAHNARAGDLDGDGDLDVFAADYIGLPPVKVHRSGGPGPGAALGFYTVPPCRLVDTRGPAGPRGGPPLFANTSRSFPLGGACEVPLTARAVSLNVAVTQPTAPGHLRLHPEGSAAPRAAALNYGAGQTRANNVRVGLGGGGRLVVFAGQSQGTAHLVIDVNGYFE